MNAMLDAMLDAMLANTMFEEVVLVDNGKHWARSEEKDVLRQCCLYESAAIEPALHWAGNMKCAIASAKRVVAKCAIA